MKYWCIGYPDENGNDVVETLSEDEILEQYYDYWSTQMIKKFGQEVFEKDWCKQDCIDDWVHIHWAWESK